MFGYTNGTYTGTATTVRAGKSLMQIQMAYISPDGTRIGQTYLCIHICTIHVNLCSAFPKVEVADTVGAGDSFTATFVAAVLKGKSVAEAHKLAVEVSAYVCTQNGAMPELPARLREQLVDNG